MGVFVNSVHSINMYCVMWTQTIISYKHDYIALSDVNECEDDVFPCANKAECNDTEGSFECSCLSGYSGDGYENCTGL